MCGIACFFGNDKIQGYDFGINALKLLQHRGPDDKGIYSDDHGTLIHTRLSILELSELGKQPMHSACGRYCVVYNGEIYNHMELRKRHLPGHTFKGHSDTETLIELFSLQREDCVLDMVGMWSMVILDKQTGQLFVSRSRFGQKPLYLRLLNNTWRLASEIKPLLMKDEQPELEPTALAEFLALGNYGHLGTNTIYKDIMQFPPGSYAWIDKSNNELNIKKYWEIPEIRDRDKVPFDTVMQKELHDCIVEAVLSETISDVPFGITLSGGIDSSVIAGILATYYNDKVNVFTAQAPGTKYDETRYLDAVVARYPGKFIVHNQNLKELSIKDSLQHFLKIQEEPFGDPSIMAHGNLMKLASEAGIKVILNGQGADELFFGYSNMVRSVLSKQFKVLELSTFFRNINKMKAGKSFFSRIILQSILPTLEYKVRKESRIKARDILNRHMLPDINENIINIQKHDNTYNVWLESMYGVNIPHLVHYDDRNAMACGIEGRMPFLDHRIAACVAKIRPAEFIKEGLPKYILRESCRQYMPDIVYNRQDKIGFYTPLVSMMYKDTKWIDCHLSGNNFFKKEHTASLTAKLMAKTLNTADALQIWRCISTSIFMASFHGKL